MTATNKRQLRLTGVFLMGALTSCGRRRRGDEKMDKVILDQLLPCPFCGGGTYEIRENGKVWSGMSYTEPISVSILHWCKEMPGPSRMIERIGRDLAQATERWNVRYQP